MESLPCSILLPFSAPTSYRTFSLHLSLASLPSLLSFQTRAILSHVPEILKASGLPKPSWKELGFQGLLVAGSQHCSHWHLAVSPGG